MSYAEAFALQRRLVEERKLGQIGDQLLFVEHPHTITLGRNGKLHNLLASDAALASAGVTFHESNRGGDITYHGPGQIVCYPIVDLREWKRDVVAYVRALEQVQIDALADFDIAAERVCNCTGVWVNGAKAGAIGVHISRWVASHGFALNVNTDLSYFQYIVPCGIAKPVTSMQVLGSSASMEQVRRSLAEHFGRVFECEVSLSVSQFISLSVCQPRGDTLSTEALTN
jgi:lipoyl(octanoyl) transferase